MFPVTSSKFLESKILLSAVLVAGSYHGGRSEVEAPRVMRATQLYIIALSLVSECKSRFAGNQYRGKNIPQIATALRPAGIIRVIARCNEPTAFIIHMPAVFCGNR